MGRRTARCDASGWSCCLAPARRGPPPRVWAGRDRGPVMVGLEHAQSGGPNDAGRADPIPEGVGAADARGAHSVAESVGAADTNRAHAVAEIIHPDDAG